MTQDVWDRIADYERTQKEQAFAVRRRQHLDAFEAQKAKRQSEIALLAKTEKVAVGAWVSLASPYFRIQHEVRGTHYTGKRLRMDMLLHPRFEWSGGGHHPIGLEIKKPMHRSGHLIGQAADYAASSWESDAHSDPVSVFVAVYDEMALDHGIAQVLGGIGVIYFGPDEKSVGLNVRCSYNRMWSERDGVVNNKWSAQRKFGSR